MKDKQFLLISSLTSLLLILFNYPLFIKSISTSKFTNNQIKLAAVKAEFKGFQKAEAKFWNSIKEIDLDGVEQNTDTDKIIKTKIASIQKKDVPQIKNTQPLATTAKTKPKPPLTRYLFAGDSIMYALGVELQNGIKKSLYKIDTVKVDYKVSSGLNRIDFYDWYKRTPQIISKYNPEAMVVIFGGNDDQDILDINGVYRGELTPEWEKAYEERVKRYAKLIEKSSVKKVYWVGHPMSNLPRYNKFFPIFNKIYQKVANSNSKIEFIDCWNVFADNGKFKAVVANKSGKKKQVRTRDGIHFTHHGAKIIADIVIEKMMKDEVLQLKSNSKSSEKIISTKNN